MTVLQNYPDDVCISVGGRDNQIEFGAANGSMWFQVLKPKKSSVIHFSDASIAKQGLIEILILMRVRDILKRR